MLYHAVLWARQSEEPENASAEESGPAHLSFCGKLGASFLIRGKPRALLWRRNGKYGLPGKFLNKSRTAFLAVLYAFPAVGFDGILKRKREIAAKVDMRAKILLQEGGITYD